MPRKSSKTHAQDAPQGETSNFEESLAELEKIVSQMEQGDLTLEDMLENFERGVQLGKTCQKAIDDAEQRVRILTEKEGDAELVPFPADGQPVIANLCNVPEEVAHGASFQRS